MQVERLGSFSAERQMQSRVQHFMDDRTLTLLVLQADRSQEEGHVTAHAKFVVDEACAQYVRRGGAGEEAPTKVRFELRL